MFEEGENSLISQQPASGARKVALFLRSHWEVILYLLLILIAGFMRFWALDYRPIHHDESLFATPSWYVFEGRDYIHDPLLHGPFQILGMELAFSLFGVSDYIARILPALFGTLLVGMPYLLRPFLGRGGSLVTAAFLAFSPSMLYLSRFARNDIYMVVWTLALVIFLWRYMQRGKSRYLYLMALFLSLSFSTKENTYLTVGILGVFLFVITARELFRRFKSRLRLSALSPPASYLLLLVTLTLPLLGPVTFIPLRWLGLDLPSPVETFTETGKVGLFAPTVAVVSLFVVGAFFGLRWNWRRWLICAFIFYGLFALLYTGFFSTKAGFATGLWGSLDYWLGQHGMRRLDQPWFFYLMILSVYEFLPLFFGIIAMVRYRFRGDLFSRFLVYWAVISLVLYSYAGEKVPWLIVHVTLPLILLAGKFIGEMLVGIDLRALKASGLKIAAVVVCGTLLVFTLRAAIQLNYDHREEPVEMMVFAQGTPELVRTSKEIARLAQQTGEGEDLAITIDTRPLGIWTWFWYLRAYSYDYENLRNLDLPPEGSVLLLASISGSKTKPFLEKYGEGQQIRVLLWFPWYNPGSEYRQRWTVGRFLGTVFSWGNWKKAGRYWLYREVDIRSNPGETIAYFPRDFTIRGKLRESVEESEDESLYQPW